MPEGNMNKNQVIEVFRQADIEILHIWELPNGYDRNNESPWWLIKTYKGLIEVGFRRHVFELNWRDTGIKVLLGPDSPYVTQSEHHIHASDYNELIEYLHKLFYKCS